MSVMKALEDAVMVRTPLERLGDDEDLLAVDGGVTAV